MGNIIDYARTETRGFDSLPFRAADALVLAQLSYDDVPDCVATLDELAKRYGTIGHRARHFSLRRPIASLKALRHPPFDGVTIARADDELNHDAAMPDHNVENVGLVDPRVTHDFYHAVAANPRFADIEIGAFCEEFDGDAQTQFAAMTFRLRSGALVVAFRGTDDSLVGWKEDFNMAFQYPVPAQVSAAEYLERVASLYEGPIMLTGHSKGGNLAVYAAMNASDGVKDRVERIYSLDGPGFPESVVRSYEYASVSDRIVKIVPDSSVVGMVLETPERCMVVKSDVDGIMQHFAFSWQMHGGEFAKVEDVANSSVAFNKALNGWLAGLSKEQREHAVDALFAVLEASGAGSISGVMAAGPKVIPEMLGTYVGLSGEDRRNLNQALMIVLQAALARNPKVRRK
ncbi:DUF2974 domain-containing protein [uncultured Bifidobacterium sp.]|uniref:DUF2974 domain-containing protein n=1 Tax=uncultured Bifidobacterium sp. TaxID=165187 RepID=UPI000EBB0172|nr:DUF2974 domain-containing protein [uncultured Bifidobacterium sp.]HAK71909.1 hypothetical protein [Bifidobacterium sp.]